MHTYLPTIGIEIHVQLKTKTKIFCTCLNQFGSQANSNVCVICSGQPGSLPMLNKKVVEYAIKAGIALNCSINRQSSFARKHYMYPDLPKNYQITQDDTPICYAGFVRIETSAGEKKIRLNRIHMEEDAGKNLHMNNHTSLVNLNRAGTPLLEIVSEPDLSSAEEARAYLTQIHSIVQYLGISDGNMEEGSFRADINISTRREDEELLGKKVELKNINSFKFITQAIEHEINRQIELKKNGKEVTQETRLWDAKQQKSIFMRSKEKAQDYRYCPEPDIPVICIDQALIDALKASQPELALDKAHRFKNSFGLSNDDARVLTEDKLLADFFETCASLSGNPKSSSNWILRNLLGYLKEHKKNLSGDQGQCMTPELLADLIKSVDQGIISNSAAQEVFNEAAATGKSIASIIEEKDLAQLDNTQELELLIDRILAEQQESVARYKQGQSKLLMFFVGLIMKETRGKGNPVTIKNLLEKKLTD